MTDSTSRLSAMAMEVAADPGSPHYPELAAALVEAGRYAEAVAVCERGLAILPSTPAQRILAEAQLLLPDLPAARRSAEQLLSHDPRDPVALRVLGSCLLSLGDSAGAREALERSAAIDPSDMRTLDLLSGLPEAATPGEHGWSGPSFSHELDMPTAEELAPSRESRKPEDSDPFSVGAPNEAESFFGTTDSLGSLDPLGTEDPFAARGSPPPPPALEDPFDLPAPPSGEGLSGKVDPFAPDASKSAEDPFGSADPFNVPAPRQSESPFDHQDPFASSASEHQADDPFSFAPPAGEAASGPPPSPVPSPGPPPKSDPFASTEFFAGDAGGIPQTTARDFDLDTGPPEPPNPSPAGELEEDPFGPSDESFSPQPLPGTPAAPEDSPASAEARARAKPPSRAGEGTSPSGPAWPGTAGRAKTAVPVALPKKPLTERNATAARLAGVKYYLIGGGGTVVLAALLITMSLVKSDRAERAFEVAMAAARVAMTVDTAPGYREAGLYLAEALEKKPLNPEALGKAAFAATMLHTRFGVGIEAALAAEDYLALAEPQSTLAPEAAAARGLLNLQVQRPADAVSAVTRSLGDHPNHPALLWIRAQAEVLLDREDLALRSLRSAMSADPSFLPAAVTLTEMLAASGYPEEAAAIRREVFEKNPGHLATLNSLIEDAEAGHTDPEALHQTVLQSIEGWEELPTELRCSLHLGAARAAILAGEPGHATLAEDRARALQNEQTCQTELGRLLIARHRPVEAYRALASVATRGDFSVRREAAHAALMANRPEWAIDMLSSGREPIDKALLALALHRHGRAQEARAAAEAASRETEPRVAAVLALVAIAEGDKQAAGLFASRARVAESGPLDALSAGIALLEVNEARQAFRVLDLALQNAEYPHYELLVAAARAAATTGREAAALNRLERAISLNPEPEPAIEMYLDLASTERAARFFARLPAPWGAPLVALAHFHARDFDRAQQERENARQESSGFWMSYLNACVDGGTDSLRSLIASDQTRMMPRLTLVDRSLSSGRVAEALDLVRDGLRRNPGHPRAQARLAEATALASTNPLEATDRVREVLGNLAAHPVDRVTLGRVQGSLALACAASGDNRCARQAIAQARRLAPRDGRTLLLVGRSLELTGDSRAARAAYIAASTEVGAEEALLRRGLLSRGTEATTALQAFLESAPGHALAPLASQALANAQ